MTPQTPAITIPNELTVAHAWKDEKRPREYDFDAVFGPTASQVRAARPRQRAASWPPHGGRCCCVVAAAPWLLLQRRAVQVGVQHVGTGRAPCVLHLRCYVVCASHTHKLSHTQVCAISLCDRHGLLSHTSLCLQEEIFEDTKHLVRSALDGEWVGWLLHSTEVVMVGHRHHSMLPASCAVKSQASLLCYRSYPDGDATVVAADMSI